MRYLKSELQRRSAKELQDGEVIKVLKTVQKLEREACLHQERATSTLLELVNGYLPKTVSEDEIKEWILENCELTVPNKMKHMGKIMAHFGVCADGKTVRKVLEAL